MMDVLVVAAIRRERSDRDTIFLYLCILLVGDAYGRAS